MKLVILLLLLSFHSYAGQICRDSQKNADPNVNITEEQNVVNTILEEELISAIKANNLEKLKELLADGADPNTIHRGINGNKIKPVLFIAMEYENLEAFKLLLSYGANANATKTADGVFDNNLLMVAFRRHARNEGKGKLTRFINIMLNQKYVLDDKEYSFDLNSYAIGGIDAYRDVVSIIHKNGSNAESLALLYSHPNIDPKKFIYKKNYITGSAIRGEVDFLNLYLEFNAEKVNPRHAKKALEYLSEKFNNEEHKTANMELIQRLREIADKK